MTRPGPGTTAGAKAPAYLALTRAVSPRLAECELTHLARTPIDVPTAFAQHHRYEQLLTSLGCEVRRVAPAPDHPDSVFIEDTAVVFDDVAVVTRPGAPSRRAEVRAVEEALTPLRALVRIVAPAILDGGDVCAVGKRVFVGRTTRTDDAGIAQLRTELAPFGYSVRAVDVSGCLHLKSAATAIDDHTVLLNPEWVDAGLFAPLETVAVDPAEPMAANVLRIGDTLVYADAYPLTRARLEARGQVVHTVAATEIAKAEGAVTCCSLVLRAQR
ncbi:MAG: dimethylargininase [Gemmatimonadota bacterium]|nr:dimethylargininase [Gemmatimonadota bacterium]